MEYSTLYQPFVMLALIYLEITPYSFSGDVIVNITVMCLIVVGGLGFPVYSDFTTHLKFAKEHKLHINYVVKNLDFILKLHL